MGRPNAWTQLHDDIRRIGSEARGHGFESTAGDVELGSFAARMNQPDGRGHWIDQINRAAIGHMNSEKNAAQVRDQPSQP